MLQLDLDAPENPGAGIIPDAHGFWGKPASARNVLCRLMLALPCLNPSRFPPYCGKNVNRSKPFAYMCVSLYVCMHVQYSLQGSYFFFIVLRIYLHAFLSFNRINCRYRNKFPFFFCYKICKQLAF